MSGWLASLAGQRAPLRALAANRAVASLAPAAEIFSHRGLDSAGFADLFSFPPRENILPSGPPGCAAWPVSVASRDRREAARHPDVIPAQWKAKTRD